MTLVRSTTRTARIPHYCDSCDGYTIRAGDRYRSLVAPPGGELGYDGWSRMNECAKCAERYGRTVAAATVETKRCHQCGRTGTRGFHTWPAEDVLLDGRVVVPANDFTECTGKIACRRRSWKRSGGAAGQAERLRMYE